MRRDIINARVTFHKSPIHILEQFTFRDIGEAHGQFRVHTDLDECVILQTCNRVELFAAGNADLNRIKKTWASLSGLDSAAFEDRLEYEQNSDAYRHLLHLTSGLDSMVIGEEQILGQVKNSISVARQDRSSGDFLNTLFDKAIHIGTRIRNTTKISKGRVSVGSMAVKLAEENVDNLKSKRILLIGTGETSTLVAKSLTRRAYKFDVTSRTILRARTFCDSLGGTPVRFEDTLAHFDTYDVILVATTAPYFLVTYDRITDAIGKKKGGIMILDMSNPRTVDEKVAMLSGVKLMNLDQIAEMVDKNRRSRLGEIHRVQDIIDRELDVIEASMNRLNAEPLVKKIFKDADMLRERELHKALKMLGEDDMSRVKIIDDLTRAVVEGIMSLPMNNLRRACESGQTDIVETANKLFDPVRDEQ